MNVDLARKEHIEFISTFLSTYFSNLNDAFKYSRYKSDYDLMYKNVKERIEAENSNFVYLVAEESGSPLGFINILIDENNIGSILILTGENKEVKKLLLEEAIKLFRDRKIRVIYGEIVKSDLESVNILEEMGMQELLTTFNLCI